MLGGSCGGWCLRGGCGRVGGEMVFVVEDCCSGMVEDGCFYGCGFVVGCL